MQRTKPQKLVLKVKSREMLNSKILKICFEVTNIKNFLFYPGQHINIEVGSKVSRPYSIAGISNSSNLVCLVVSAGHSGVGVDILKSFKEGDIVNALGPLGKFGIKSPTKPNIVMVATGTGIVPVYSILLDLAVKENKSTIKLYFGLRNESETFMIEELDNFKDKLDFSYELCLSEPSDMWGGNKGRVGEFVTVENPKETQVYLVGHGEMVKDMITILLGIGMEKEAIFS